MGKGFIKGTARVAYVLYGRAAFILGVLAYAFLWVGGILYQNYGFYTGLHEGATRLT